jgi:3-hydroxyisobutyrate dehydrogenase
VKIGLIGPGRMGRPMLDRLAADGHHVTALVRHPDAQKVAETEGVIWADSVAATVQGADAVVVVVLNDEQLRSVCLGTNGAIAAMKRGATLIQPTPTDPATAQLLVDAGAAFGVRILDAALSGGPHDIAAGSLTLWVGGDEADVEAMRPLLQTYASPILFVGPAGNGQRVKLVNNALFVAQVGLVIDAVRLAGSLGIEEQMILAAVQHGSGSSRALDIVARGSVDAIAGRLGALMQKDVTVVRAVAREAGVDLGIIGSVLSSDAVENGILNEAGRPGGAP